MKTNNRLLVVALLLILDLVCCSQACAQVQQAWAARSVGANGGLVAIKTDGAGNVYVVGHSYNVTPPNHDYATIKYDPNGNQLWIARYAGPDNSDDLANDVAVDSAGNVYVTGNSIGTNACDQVTLKYDTKGNQLWVATQRSTFGTAIVVDAAGNVYVTGLADAVNEHLGYVTIKYDA